MSEAITHTVCADARKLHHNLRTKSHAQFRRTLVIIREACCGYATEMEIPPLSAAEFDDATITLDESITDLTKLLRRIEAAWKQK